MLVDGGRFERAPTVGVTDDPDDFAIVAERGRDRDREVDRRRNGAKNERRCTAWALLVEAGDRLRSRHLDTCRRIVETHGLTPSG